MISSRYAFPLLLLASVFFLFLLYSTFLSPPAPSMLECTPFSRDAYSLSPSVFELLPPIPSCLLDLSSAVESGSFVFLSSISPDLYLQH